MKQLFLIISREYLTRVTNRTFILSTLLTPFIIAAFGILLGWISTYDQEDKETLAVFDRTGLLEVPADNQTLTIYHGGDTELSVLKKLAEADSIDALVEIAAMPLQKADKAAVIWHFKDKPSLKQTSKVSDQIEAALRQYKIKSAGIDTAVIKALDVSVDLKYAPLTPSIKETNPYDSIIGAAMGGIFGIFMYMAVLLYGSMVMRSVMEEKTSRIVEVLISSVRPRQLLLGKVIGVGAVGLTQLIIWLVLSAVLSLITSALLMPDASQLQPGMMPNLPGGGAEAMQAAPIVEIMAALGHINWWFIIPVVIFYFFAGYMFYALLFAALGSAMGDDMEQSQSFSLILTMPIMVGFYMMVNAIENPEGPMAFWGSLIPFTSPMVMVSRLGSEPPLWEIGLSAVLLVLGCWSMVWVASRIYRVGILMYGKKVTFKELWRWIKMAE
jgi:ABC-2 type transport system permease protein